MNKSLLKSNLINTDIPKHKRPIQFVVESIPFESLNGEEHPSQTTKFISSDKNGGEKHLLRRLVEVENYRKDPEILLPILPWKRLKRIIGEDYLGMIFERARKADSKEDSDSEELEKNVASTKMSLNTAAPVPITIPFGFQLQRSILNGKFPLRLAQYISSGMFATIDTHYVSLWKGLSRIHQVPIAHKNKKSVGISQEQMHASSEKLSGISKWKYISKYQIYIMTNLSLQIKIFDSHFKELSSVSTTMPILYFMYLDEKDEVITGEVGSIKVWSLIKENINHKIVFHIQLKLEINDFEEGEWVSYLKYDRVFDRLFAAADTSLVVYEYRSGKRIETLRAIHDLSITCVNFYEPTESIITGGKDGSIKIWVRNYLVHNFHEHFNAITDLALMEDGCQALRGTMPRLISSSLDCTIRIWNIENGQCLYRFDSTEQILGMSFFRKNMIYYYTESGIYMMNVNGYQVPFTHFKTTPMLLKRIDYPTRPSRIIAACKDGGIRFVSPVTGLAIGSMFPLHKDCVPKDVLYDTFHETVYAYCGTGDIIVYNTSTSPGKLIEVWELQREKITCICPIVTARGKKKNNNQNYNPFADPNDWRSNAPHQTLHILAGTMDGQIAYMDSSAKGKSEILIQAHLSKIEFLHYDETRNLLLSGGSDLHIKIWNVVEARIRQDLMNEDGTEKTTFRLYSYSFINLCMLNQLTPVACICPMTGYFAFPYNGSIVVESYTKKNVVLSLPRIKDNSVEVSHICRLETYKLWGATMSDKFVRIYDDEAKLIREIQFNECISSFCFANTRGDLLVGQLEQITLVKIQDYLPPKYLLEAFQSSFTDDIKEGVRDFNNNLDFWEFVYKDLDKQGDRPEKWHIKTQNNRNVTFDKRDEFIQNETKLNNLLSVSVQKKDRQHRKKLKKAFLEFEMNIYIKSKQYEVQKVGQDVDWKNGDQVRSFVELETHQELSIIRPDSPTDGNSEIQKETLPIEWLSNPNPKSTDIVEIKKGEEDVIMNEVKNDAKESLAPLTDIPNESIKQFTPENEQQEPIQSTSVSMSNVNEPFPLIKKTRKIVKGAIPNSSYAAYISSIKLLPNKERTKQIASLIRRTGKLNENRTTAPISYTITSELSAEDEIPFVVPTRHYDIHRRESSFIGFNGILKNPMDSFKDDDDDYDFPLNEEDEEEEYEDNFKDGKAKSKKSKSKKSKKTKKAKKIGEKKEDSKSEKPIQAQSIRKTEAKKPSKSRMSVDPFVLNSIESVENREETMQEIKEDEEEEPAIQTPKMTKSTFLLPKSRHATPPSISSTSLHSVALPPMQSMTRISQPAVVTPPIMKSKESIAPPIQPKEIEMNRKESSSTSRESNKIEVQSKPPPPIIRQSSSIKKEPASTLKKRVSLPPKNSVDIDLEQQRRSSQAEEKRRNTLLKEEAERFERLRQQELNALKNRKDKEDETTKNIVVIEHTDIKELGSIAEKQTWSFLNDLHKDDKGQKKKEVITIPSVISDLIEKLRYGNSLAKCEASKNILYMYHTFKDDYSEEERFDLFIKPQIEILNTEKNWKVKSQLCNNLPAFNVEHNDIHVALICALADEDPQVKSSAISSLFKMGIFSKDALKVEMIRLGMLPSDKGMQKTKQESILDILYKKSLQLQSNTLALKTEDVNLWLSKYDLDYDVLHREPSYIQHLVYPEELLGSQKVVKSAGKGKFVPFSDEMKGWETDVHSNTLSIRKVKTAQDKFRPTLHSNSIVDLEEKEIQRPITASFVPRAALKKRCPTARQKARWGARCLLAGKVDLKVEI